jgi:hypothetical protein
MVLPQITLGQISIDPWTDQPSPREKKEILSNKHKNNKDMQQRVWGTLSSEERGGESLLEL